MATSIRKLCHFYYLHFCIRMDKLAIWHFFAHINPALRFTSFECCIFLSNLTFKFYQSNFLVIQENISFPSIVSQSFLYLWKFFTPNSLDASFSFISSKINRRSSRLSKKAERQYGNMQDLWTNRPKLELWY